MDDIIQTIVDVNQTIVDTIHTADDIIQTIVGHIHDVDDAILNVVDANRAVDVARGAGVTPTPIASTTDSIGAGSPGQTFVYSSSVA